MYVIAGLGNPKKEYENTRHNIGFAVIDMLADRHGIRMNEAKHKGLIGKGFINGEKVILVKPLTFMNLSGECIREVVDYYKVDAKENLIVLHDDISLEPGVVRIRKKGSAGGHNGLKNIILHLGHDQFQRVKIGVGEKPEGYDLADYVLGHFSKQEKELMNQVAEEVCDAVEVMMKDGPDAAMNRFNSKSKRG
ncbi:MAG: aminoacyl-tRNA hydrolase [Eubacteriales bacterium]|nr:aminoacyl-tRNA hydrolase [Eubacteriales bacterium]